MTLHPALTLGCYARDVSSGETNAIRSKARAEEKIMKNRLKLWIGALCLASLSLPAMADTLELTSTGGASVDGADIYPYNFSVNGSSTPMSLMCIDYNLHITMGETWNVTEESIPTDNSTSSVDLRALALIDYALATGYGGYSTSDLQFADWSILDAADVDSLSGYTSGQAAAIAQGALQEATDSSLIDSGFYSNFTLYAADPTNTSGWTDGQPQDFIGDTAPDPTSETPEPSSVLLLGTVLLSTLGVVRKRFA